MCVLLQAFIKVWWRRGLARASNQVKCACLFQTQVQVTNVGVNSSSCPPSARLQMSNTFYEAAGQNWFTLDSVHIHYNWTQEATFNASEVYAPATSSYHCQHVSSLHKYDTLLVPSSHTDTSANWHITFTDFQVPWCTRFTAFSCGTRPVMSAHSLFYHSLSPMFPVCVHMSVYSPAISFCAQPIWLSVNRSLFYLFFFTVC